MATSQSTTTTDHGEWGEWLQKLGENGLAAILQERKADGEPSTFIKLVSRDDAGGD